MDVGSQPLTMDENWTSSSAFRSCVALAGVAQGWGEPAGSAKRGLKDGPADMDVRRRQRE